MTARVLYNMILRARLKPRHSNRTRTRTHIYTRTHVSEGTRALARPALVSLDIWCAYAFTFYLLQNRVGKYCRLHVWNVCAIALAQLSRINGRVLFAPRVSVCVCVRVCARFKSTPSRCDRGWTNRGVIAYCMYSMVCMRLYYTYGYGYLYSRYSKVVTSCTLYHTNRPTDNCNTQKCTCAVKTDGEHSNTSHHHQHSASVECSVMSFFIVSTEAHIQHLVVHSRARGLSANLANATYNIYSDRIFVALYAQVRRCDCLCVCVVWYIHGTPDETHGNRKALNIKP